jgi:hypothetical protein
MSDDLIKRVLLSGGLRLSEAIRNRIEELERERDDLTNRITAMETGDWSEVRLVRFENGQLDLAAGPIPVIAEYLAQMMEDGEDKYFNFMEMQIDHKSAGPMVLSLQRKNGQTPNELRKESEAKLTQALSLVEDAFCEGFGEGYDGGWIGGDYTHAWKKSDVKAELEKE